MASHKDNREKTAYSWSESRSYLRWETPIIGWNSEGKISTFIPGCQVFFTQMDGDKNIVSNKTFTTVDGTSGISTNPVQPHTVTKEARTCNDCHMSRKALGLGGGYYNIEKNFPDGAPIDFELERIVDEEGKQIQATNHVGARPLNKAEQQKIMRSGTCVACHGADAEVFERAKSKAGVMQAPTDDVHTKGIQKILEKAGGGWF